MTTNTVLPAVALARDMIDCQQYNFTVTGSVASALSIRMCSMQMPECDTPMQEKECWRAV